MTRRQFVFSEPFPYLKHHFGEFVEVAFLDVLEADKENALLFGTLKQRFIEFTKHVFKTTKGKLWGSQGHLPTSNFTSSTSSN
jgi:hypothetical protein